MPDDSTHIPEHYCHRGDHCAERIRTTTGYQPAMIHAARGLCVTDTTQLRHAISDLPTVYDDLGADLAGGQLGGGEKVTHTADLQVPVDLYLEALQAEIDHELLCWVEPVAEQLRVTWDTQAARDCRPSVRVRRAAHLLARALPALLSLRGVVHMMWVDAELTPMDRAGLDGALALIALHRRGRYAAGTRSAVLTLPSPCPHCERACLHRRDGGDVVTCAYCHETWTWDEYQEDCMGALAAA